MLELRSGESCNARRRDSGSGVYASHGYERSHVDGALATLKVLIGYIG